VIYLFLPWNFGGFGLLGQAYIQRIRDIRSDNEQGIP